MNNNDLNNQFNNINDFQNSNVENINAFNNTNINNPNDLYNDDSMKQAKAVKKSFNTKIFVFIILIVIIILSIIVLKGNVSKKNKNTTGLTEYKDSDVEFNCKYESLEANPTITIYQDFIFNNKTTGSSGETYNYQMKEYGKVIIKYDNTITDEQYKKFIDSLNSLSCISGEESCTESHLEIDITTFGTDTVVDRYDDEIIVTYNQSRGLGSTATKEDIKKTKDDLIKNGFVCN